MVGSIFSACRREAAEWPLRRPLPRRCARDRSDGRLAEKLGKDCKGRRERRRGKERPRRFRPFEAGRGVEGNSKHCPTQERQSAAFSTTAPATPSAAPVRNSNGWVFELAGRGISAPTSAPAPPAAPVGGVGLATGYAGGGSAGMTVSAPAPTPAESKPSSGKRQDALQGVRSLKIDTEQDSSIRGPVLQFTSLGVDPQLKSAWPSVGYLGVPMGLALVVVLVRTRQTKSAFWGILRYVVVVVLLGTILPLPFDGPHWVELGNAAVFAAFALNSLLLRRHALSDVCCLLPVGNRRRVMPTAAGYCCTWPWPPQPSPIRRCLRGATLWFDGAPQAGPRARRCGARAVRHRVLWQNPPQTPPPQGARRGSQISKVPGGTTAC